MLNTPILFLVFNRINTTKQVFARIREIQPKQFFVAADGAREDKDGEIEKCEEVRQFILDNINWNCEVKTLFREKNLGCGRAVSEAITWFFDNVEQGIILEDDCLPELSFFGFCEKMLEKYKTEEKIASIGGTNHFFCQFDQKNSYYFSNLAPIWGWATWKRVWKTYQFILNEQDIQQIKSKIEHKISHKKIQLWLLNTFNDILEQKVNTWDIQWTYMVLNRNLLSIIPYRNQIKNIGYAGTHTDGVNNKHLFFEMPTCVIELADLGYLSEIKANEKMDNITYKTIIKHNFEQSFLNAFLNMLRAYTPEFIRIYFRKLKAKF